MKIRFQSNDNLPLHKLVSICCIIIINTYVFFLKDYKYYSQVYLYKCVYESVTES